MYRLEFTIPKLPKRYNQGQGAHWTARYDEKVCMTHSLIKHENKQGGIMKGKRGFGSMDKERLKDVARIGGLKISQNVEHMSRIGKKGAEKSRERRLQAKEQSQQQDQA
jgi:general stress protein YciG